MATQAASKFLLAAHDQCAVQWHSVLFKRSAETCVPSMTGETDVRCPSMRSAGGRPRSVRRSRTSAIVVRKNGIGIHSVETALRKDEWSTTQGVGWEVLRIASPWDQHKLFDLAAQRNLRLVAAERLNSLQDPGLILRTHVCPPAIVRETVIGLPRCPG